MLENCLGKDKVGAGRRKLAKSLQAGSVVFRTADPKQIVDGRDMVKRARLTQPKLFARVPREITVGGQVLSHEPTHVDKNRAGSVRGGYDRRRHAVTGPELYDRFPPERALGALRTPQMFVKDTDRVGTVVHRSVPEHAKPLPDRVSEGQPG